MVAEAVEALFKHAHEKEYFSGACLVRKAGETVYTGAFGMAHIGGLRGGPSGSSGYSHLG